MNSEVAKLLKYFYTKESQKYNLKANSVNVVSHSAYGGGPAMNLDIPETLDCVFEYDEIHNIPSKVRIATYWVTRSVTWHGTPQICFYPFETEERT